MNPRFAFLLLAVLCLQGSVGAQDAPKPMSQKEVLLEQLRTTHDEKDWFVPANQAIEGLTPEQASWKDAAGNHSIGQLVNHLIFWDQRALQKFKGEPQAKFSGDNNETFNNFDSKSWAAAVKQLDAVLAAWEQAVEAADDAKIKLWASTIAHIGAHNAYHIGPIIYIRKLQGSWDPEKGVK
jgi:uncharacterized damage-inducible protein DinB